MYLRSHAKTSSGEIWHVFSSCGQLKGYVHLLFREDQHLYIVGHLDDREEKKRYKQLLYRFITGLKQTYSTHREPFIRISCGHQHLDVVV